MLTTWKARLDGWRAIARRGYLGRYLLGRLLVASGASARLTFARDGYKLRFYPSALTLTLWAAPADREGDEQFVRRWLEPGDLFVDVGANVGALALAAATRVGDRGRVVAIEPHPRTFGYLQGNVALNGLRNITAINAAVGDETGDVYFSDRHSDDQNAVSTSPTSLRVPLVRLDDLDLGTGPIALLKIDVEGYERFVLQGASQLLARVDAVYFEAWEQHFRERGYATRDVVLLLAAAGFTTYQFAQGGLAPAADDYEAVQCVNLLAVRPSADPRLARVRT